MFQIHHVGSMSTFSESSQIRKSSQWMSFQLCFCHLHINRVDHRQIKGDCSSAWKQSVKPGKGFSCEHLLYCCPSKVFRCSVSVSTVFYCTLSLIYSISEAWTPWNTFCEDWIVPQATPRYCCQRRSILFFLVYGVEKLNEKNLESVVALNLFRNVCTPKLKKDSHWQREKFLYIKVPFLKF